MDFTGKTAYITGAASGIGRATAKLLSEGGAKIAVSDVDAQGLTSLKAEIEGTGGVCFTHVCDVSDEAASRAVAAEVIAELSQLDILINNAGIFRHGIMPFHKQDSDIWKKKVDINIYGTLYTTHAVLPHMYERRYGRIVNVASVAATYGIRNMVDYSMTKGAILSFTYALAREAAEYNVAVNAMSPGNIASKDGDGGESLSYLGRRGEPEECAKVIAFLASDDASWVSGVNFTADGCRKKI